MAAPRKSISPGTVFNRLTVVSIGEPKPWGNGWFKSTSVCVCECGTIKTIPNSSLGISRKKFLLSHKMKIIPRYYQTDAIESAWSFLCTNSGSPVIVLPTGSGKTTVIAELCKKAIIANGRVIVLAHKKELLEQSSEKILGVLPELDVGIYSAGLKSRDTEHDVLVAGIQSVYNRAGEFGARHLILLDECHLLPSDGEGMYRRFLHDLRAINPHCRLVGLTATPFRTGEGSLCRADGLLQKICYSAPIKRLIDEGYLCNLVTSVATNSVDTSGLHIRAGEFVTSEMVALFSDEERIRLACKELVEKTAGRQSTLIFAAGVQHATEVAKQVGSLTNEECGIVVGDTNPMERATLLARFKRGELKRLVNVDVLSTGFDSPNIDSIAVLRSTASPGLFAQICGRGLRIAPGKTDCLILDFGSNIKRHGPIDSPGYGEDSKPKGTGDGPSKTCPNCGEQVALSARSCTCGWNFPPPERQMARHEEKAGSDAILVSQQEPTRWLVEEVLFSRHKKKNGTPDDPDTLRVDYVCQPEDGEPGNISQTTISEWVCLEHYGYAKVKALKWWKHRSIASVDGIDEAISLWQRGAVAAPSAILVVPDGRFTRITGYELDELPESWADVGEVGETWENVEVELPF